MIRYKKGYKYQLLGDYTVKTNVSPGKIINTEFIRLSESGELTVKSGYAWNGASGPAIDTKNFMRGSMCHDAFYQLIRMGLLHKTWREAADRELRKMCLEDGMSRLRAWYVYKSVQIAGAGAAEKKEKIFTAP